jgi:hypothetical protein
MRYAVLGLFCGLALFSSLAAQAPAQPPGNAPPPGSFQPQGARGSRGAPGGFGAQRIPPSGITTQPERPSSQLLDRADVGLPREFAPLPESASAGRMLMLDVLVAEMEKTLTQPTAADILEMEKNGKLVGKTHIRLLSLENQPSFAQFGELASKVSGRATTGLSVVPIYNSVNVGTIVQATSRIEADGTALIQVYVQKSALVRSPDPPELREPEGITRISGQSTVRAKAGEPVLLSAGPSNGTDAAAQTWIVLSYSPL